MRLSCDLESTCTCSLCLDLFVFKILYEFQVLEVFESGERSPGDVKVERLDSLFAQGSPVALRHPQASHLVGLLEVDLL